MKIMEKVWGSLGLFESAEPEEERKAPEPAPRPRPEEREPKPKRTNNVVTLPTAANAKPVRVMVVEPFSFDDAQHVADHLKDHKPVIVNFENTDPEVTKRMIDFISGTTYALMGTIRKVGAHIFLCAPNNVDVLYNPAETDAHSNMMWGNK